MKINILGKTYEVIDTKEKVTIADSFVVRQNKIGSGNGEAKLYVGNESEWLRNFFGNIGFVNKCFLLKKDLLKYLDETQVEYLKPEQAYINKSTLPNLWRERKEKINNLPEKIDFEIFEQTQITGPRIYIKSSDMGYKLIRELSLPNITFISIVKLCNENNKIEYYFKLFADYFGNITHPYVIEQEQQSIEAIINPEKKKIITTARIGQGKYREELLKICPFCPITMVSDDRLLIASHIKPWAKSNENEKIDPYNGFMFTPTFDYLFDRGFLSFTDDKRTILSPFLSKMTYSKLGISNNKQYPQLPIEGREKYLEYHRQEILNI
jgi:hypothetical protein